MARDTIEVMSISKIPVSVSLAALLSCTVLAADEPALPNSPMPENQPAARSHGMTLSSADRSFLLKAAKAGMKEVDVSRAVEDRLTDPSIKATAEMMITDHGKANAELAALAAQKGVDLAPDDMKAGDKWSKKTKDLEEDYVKEMKGDHEDAVKLFTKGAKSDDPDVAAFATKTLPTLEHHLSMVSALKPMGNEQSR